MIYADTDFFLALLKESDWLKQKAVRIYNQHKSDIFTSNITIVELLLLAKRFNIDSERLLVSVFQLVRVVGISKNDALAVAHCIKKYNLNVFDAFHSVLCGNSPIISSDKVYDKIFDNRIKLEDH